MLFGKKYLEKIKEENRAIENELQELTDYIKSSNVRLDEVCKNVNLSCERINKNCDLINESINNLKQKL